MHWNGTLLDTIEKAVHWAETMTWKGVRPVVCLLDRVYRLGVRLTKAELRPYCEHVCRSASLPKWCDLKWGILGSNWANCRQP